MDAVIRHEFSGDPAGQEFYLQFAERLKNLTPTFLQMRTKMGVGENIGFGTLGDAQSIVSATYSGAVLPFDINTETKEQLYGQPFFISGYGLIYKNQSTAGLKDKIFVEPVISESDRTPFPEFPARGGLVIIYDSAGLPAMTDDVIVGMIAHELAEVRVRRIGVPEGMEDILKEKAQHKDLSALDESHERNKESDYDVVAARFGYKEQTLVCLRHLLAVYEGLKKKYSNSLSAIDTLNQFSSEVEFRISQVLTYS